MIPQPPSGQGPIDPRGAFSPPPPPGATQQGAAQQGMPPMGYPSGPYAAPPTGQPPMPPMPPPGFRPMPPPPMGWMPNPYGPPRRSGLRTLMTLGLFIVIIISIGLNLILLVANSSGGGNQTVLVPGSGSDKVVVIPLTGVIESRTYQRFERFMKRAEADSSIKAVVLRIDTPGGEVPSSDEIYNRILQYKQNRKEKGQTIQVIVSMGGMATSGGYYAACGGDYLFAENTTVTGNIGVLWPSYNLSKLMEKYGVDDTTVVSNGTPYKDAGSMTRAPSPQHAQYMQHLVDAPFQRFKDVVKTGRGTRLTDTIENIANGKAYTADDAKKLGLIDDIGYLDAAISYAIKVSGASNPQVVKYNEPPTFFGLLDSESESQFFGRRGDGVTIHLDANALEHLVSPRMMYLYRGPDGSSVREE